jgi:hypothetical protein
LLPEGHHRGGVAAHAAQSLTGPSAELTEVVGAEVGQLVMFPVAPDVLHRIEFGRVGRQVCELDPTPLLGDKLSDQPAAMGFGATPGDLSISPRLGREQ